MGEYQVRLANGKQFAANAGTTLLDAALTAGLPLEHGCRTGRCGTCKTRVLQGQTTRVGSDTCLSEAEHTQGWVLSCTNAAASDLTLDTEDLAALAGIEPRTLPARIHSLELLSSDVLRLVLRLPPTAAWRALAGQYLNIVGPEGLRRSYSMASAPLPGGLLEFYVRRVPGGAMSDYWFGRAAQGDLLRLDGPRGSFYLRPSAGRHVVMLATGTGMAPLKAMLEQLHATSEQAPEQAPAALHLLWGGRTPADLFWTPSFPGLSLRVTPVLSRADASWPGARGHVQQVLLARETATATDLAHTDVYACGSPAMISGARQALVAAGLPARQFYADAFVSAT